MSDFFQKSRESQESFPSYDFTEDSRASKRGFEQLFELDKGNKISGTICREPKIVQVPSERSTTGKEDKLLLTIKVDAETKGWVSNKGTAVRERFDINNPKHAILTLWVPETGNMTTRIDEATGGKIGESQHICVEIIGTKDTGKQNLARQFKASAGNVPIRTSANVAAADLDD